MKKTTKKAVDKTIKPTSKGPASNKARAEAYKLGRITDLIGMISRARIAGIDIGKISDGYHTFDELYEHRHELYLKLAETIYWQTKDNSIHRNTVWCSLVHSDGTKMDGWFVLGIGQEPGKQITYHLPMKYWDRACQHVVKVLDKAPDYDGHSSLDVLERLRRL